MNNWLLKQVEAAFPTYNAAIAMHLHFTSSTYSYPHYNGKTSAKVETLLKRKDVGEWIKIHNTFKTHKVNPEEYFFVWFKNGGSLSAGAIQLYDFEKYNSWKERYSTKDKFKSSYQSFMDTTNLQELAKKYKSDDMPVLLSLYHAGIIDIEIVVYFLSLTGSLDGYDWESKYKGNFVYDDLMKKVSKVYEYYSWKCVV